MASTDPIVVALLEKLRAAFCNDEHPPVGGVTGQPQPRAGNGVPPLDNFNDCSLLFLNVTNRFRSNEFPNQSVSDDPCTMQKVVELQIGVARCTAVAEAVGRKIALPSADTMAAEFGVQEDDADRLDWVLCRAAAKLKNDHDILSWAPEATTVLGPEGGTVAVIATAIFQY